jgi:hypothetical protein
MIACPSTRVATSPAAGAGHPEGVDANASSEVTVEMLLSAVEAAEALLKEAAAARDPRDRAIYRECARNTLDALPLVVEQEQLEVAERRVVGLALERLRKRIARAEEKSA